MSTSTLRDTHSPLFTDQEMIQFQGVIKRLSLRAMIAPWQLLVSVVFSAILLGVVFLEWEIISRVFGAIAGNGQYWSAGVMGLNGAVMILGFHLLAKPHPNHAAVRFVDRAVGILIPLYLLGAGLFVAAMLYADGLGDITAPIDDALGFDSGSGLDGFLGLNTDTPADSAPVAAPGSWLEIFFAHLASPLSVLLFSLGLGGLALVNIFVAHRLIGLITGFASEGFDHLSRLRVALADYREIRQCQKDYQIAADERAAFTAHWNKNQTAALLACEVQSVIHEALAPHKALQRERALEQGSRFGEARNLNAANVDAGIAAIEAIDQHAIREALYPPASKTPQSRQTEQS